MCNQNACFGGGSNCCWIIIAIILLFLFCGNGNTGSLCGYNSCCSNNCGCGCSNNNSGCGCGCDNACC